MINFGKSLIDFKIPKIMGILNLTPDSFYDGGKYYNNKNILKQVELMLNEGADIIDIGGCSTKPGFRLLKIKDEIKRVINPIKIIIKHFPDIKLSIDTYRSKIALMAIDSGVHMINDISGGTIDKNMFKVVSTLKVPYILNHILEKPNNMQKSLYYNNLLLHINKYFSKKIFTLKSLGINDIILDPGFGFGKDMIQNIQILKNISLIGFKEYPIMIGMSRKSTIQNILKKSAKNCLNGTSIFNTIALLNNVSIIRVHDVKESLDCIKIINYYNSI